MKTIALVAALSFVCLALVIGYFAVPPVARGLSITRLSNKDNTAHFRFRSSSGNVRIVHSEWGLPAQIDKTGKDLNLKVMPNIERSERKVSAPGLVHVVQHHDAIEIRSEQQVFFQEGIIAWASFRISSTWRRSNRNARCSFGFSFVRRS